MNENVVDEREAENTYLVLFTSFSSFLCSASLEKERQIFQSAFSRLLCPFLSLLLAKKKHPKRMGSRRKEWSIPPHIHTLASGIFIRITSLLWLQLSSRTCGTCSLLSVLDDHAFCYCFFQVVFLNTGCFLIFFIYLTNLNSLCIT